LLGRNLDGNQIAREYRTCAGHADPLFRDGGKRQAGKCDRLLEFRSRPELSLRAARESGHISICQNGLKVLLRATVRPQKRDSSAISSGVAALKSAESTPVRDCPGLLARSDWMGPPTLRYQRNVDGTFRPSTFRPKIGWGHPLSGTNEMQRNMDGTFRPPMAPFVLPRKCGWHLSSLRAARESGHNSICQNGLKVLLRATVRPQKRDSSAISSGVAALKSAASTPVRDCPGLLARSDWMGPPTPRYQRNVDGTFRPVDARRIKIEQRIERNGASDHDREQGTAHRAPGVLFSWNKCVRLISRR
jgi:hypothetical protein